MLDNRTGRLWDQAYVDCDKAIAKIDQPDKGRSISGERLRAISEALRHDN